MEPVFMTLFLIMSIIVVNAREPVCSKFHYEEKLLEKMIRTEIKFENIVEKVRGIEDNVRESLGATSEQIQAMLTKWTEFKEEMQKSNVAALAKITQSLKEHGSKDGSSETTVSFHVHTLLKTDYNSGDVFKFTTVLLNHGNGYDSATGKFTAPVTGIYIVSAFLCTKYNEYVHFAIIHNEEKVLFGTVRDFDCVSPSLPVEISEGDTVWVKCTASSNVEQDGYRRVSFSGSLLN